MLIDLIWLMLGFGLVEFVFQEICFGKAPVVDILLKLRSSYKEYLLKIDKCWAARFFVQEAERSSMRFYYYWFLYSLKNRGLTEI